MADEKALDFYEKAIKQALHDAVENIVSEEALEASRRVEKRIAETRSALVERVVNRIKVVQRFQPGDLRFEIIFQVEP